MWPIADDETYNARQKRNRDAEWAAIEQILKPYSRGAFLDVGCGTGYVLEKAGRLGFKVVGVDPERGIYGVQDPSAAATAANVIKSVAERLPFKDATFSVVYSSHALEHFNDQNAGLAEMARVLDREGIAVIVVPTGTMALLLVSTLYLFGTHRSLGKFLLRDRSYSGLRRIFIPPPHGTEAKSAFREIKTFSIERWKRLISSHFLIKQVILPGLYPWPNYPQVFPMMRLKRFSSSVVFVCVRPACSI